MYWLQDKISYQFTMFHKYLLKRNSDSEVKYTLVIQLIVSSNVHGKPDDG